MRSDGGPPTHTPRAGAPAPVIRRGGEAVPGGLSRLARQPEAPARSHEAPREAVCPPRPATSARTKDGPSAYSHSIVPGGLDVMSSTTRLTSRSSLIMREAMRSSRS